LITPRDEREWPLKHKNEKEEEKQEQEEKTEIVAKVAVQEKQEERRRGQTDEPPSLTSHGLCCTRAMSLRLAAR
jgi:cell envelope opacity-associated protein A